MKKIISILLSATCVLSSLCVANANKEINVTLNGEKIFFDVAPQIINERTMVPLRAIFEALGATVDWNGDTQTLTSTKNDITVKLTINDSTMYVNNTPVILDSPAFIIDGRTLVPLRAISEAYQANVAWDSDTSTALITAEGVSYVAPTFDDISANITQISGFIAKGMYLEAIQECENAKSWHKLSPEDTDKINALQNEAQTKYNEYEKAEEAKMLDVYASVLLRQYRLKMKDPSSFKLNSVYAGFDSSIYSNYNFVAVVDVSGKNSFGAITRSTYTMLLQTDTGRYILDLKDYSESMADDAWGGSKIQWMDITTKALKLQMNAPNTLTKLDTNMITRLVLSV